jgi:hypothetical protein
MRFDHGSDFPGDSCRGSVERRGAPRAGDFVYLPPTGQRMM